MQKVVKIFSIITLSIVINMRSFATFALSSKDIEPQLLCLVASSHYEKKYNIPKNLLRSISIVESGKWNKEHGMTFAWPWVVGIDGKGNFFSTYAEAASFLRQAVAKGQNVDIGCHQINWKNHGHHFNKPEELLHPKTNAAYAAYFLVQKFNAVKDWSKAVAYYHSYTDKLGSKYLQRVYNVFEEMKKQNDRKYDSYIEQKISTFRSRQGMRKKAKTFPNNLISANTSQKSHASAKELNLINASDMVIFSVELPANSVMVDH